MSNYTITKGNTATFNIEFLDPVTRQPTTVTGGTITLVYSVNKTATTTILTLVPLQDWWTASWDSTPADLGQGTWAVLATGSVTNAASGKLRIVADP